MAIGAVDEKGVKERKVSDRIISRESGFIGLTRMESLGGKIIERRLFSGSSDLV